MHGNGTWGGNDYDGSYGTTIVNNTVYVGGGRDSATNSPPFDYDAFLMVFGAPTTTTPPTTPTNTTTPTSTDTSFPFPAFSLITVFSGLFVITIAIIVYELISNPSSAS